MSGCPRCRFRSDQGRSAAVRQRPRAAAVEAAALHVLELRLDGLAPPFAAPQHRAAVARAENQAGRPRRRVLLIVLAFFAVSGVMLIQSCQDAQPRTPVAGGQ